MEMLLQAAKKEGLRQVRTHTERLPFPDGFFARILMVDALHHVFNQVETAHELWRVLRPGGRLVIEEPDVQTFPVKVIALFEKLALMRSHFLPPKRIAALFSFPDVQAETCRAANNVWIILDKRNDSQWGYW
jgi:demethylmenaquinone methyltransferase/2-methoxy-6-polyprenyl-1,4-benzoquinol methylase